MDLDLSCQLMPEEVEEDTLAKSYAGEYVLFDQVRAYLPDETLLPGKFIDVMLFIYYLFNNNKQCKYRDIDMTVILFRTSQR